PLVCSGPHGKIARDDGGIHPTQFELFTGYVVAAQFQHQELVRVVDDRQWRPGARLGNRSVIPHGDWASKDTFWFYRYDGNGKLPAHAGSVVQDVVELIDTLDPVHPSVDGFRPHCVVQPVNDEICHLPWWDRKRQRRTVQPSSDERQHFFLYGAVAG